MGITLKQLSDTVQKVKTYIDDKIKNLDNNKIQSDWNETDTSLDSYINNKPEIPSKVSQLENDSNYLTDYTETDPTVPAWAKNSTKPEYTAVEVGALSSDTTHLIGDVPITRKINNKTLNADIMLTASDIGADSSGSADTALESAKKYTDTQITNLVNGAPTTLDTLKEIADAMEENDNVVTALETSISNKVDKIAGKSLSTNDYTTEEKNKLAGIAENANNYTHPTTVGNKHIPSGGSSGQILRWSADGTAVWGDDNNTEYNVATQSVNGLMSSMDKSKLDGIGYKILTISFLSENQGMFGNTEWEATCSAATVRTALENIGITNRDEIIGSFLIGVCPSTDTMAQVKDVDFGILSYFVNYFDVSTTSYTVCTIQSSAGGGYYNAKFTVGVIVKA